ncbi:hypothetical protein LINPERPRIM_LOCUS42941 [Linum perenne]
MMTLAAATTAAALSAARPSSLTRSIFTPLATLSSSSPARKLVLYSKPGCCLCDGLKEKLQAAFSLAGPSPLHDVDLQVRDITTNPDWEKAYQYEIPVLAKLHSDGSEVSNFFFQFQISNSVSPNSLP